MKSQNTSMRPYPSLNEIVNTFIKKNYSTYIDGAPVDPSGKIPTCHIIHDEKFIDLKEMAERGRWVTNDGWNRLCDEKEQCKSDFKGMSIAFRKSEVENKLLRDTNNRLIESNKHLNEMIEMKNKEIKAMRDAEGTIIMNLKMRMEGYKKMMNFLKTFISFSGRTKMQTNQEFREIVQSGRDIIHELDY